MKAKVGDLEEEVRKLYSRWMRKELIGVIESVSGKKRFLVRFHYGFGKVLSLNKLDEMMIGGRPKTKEAELPKIYAIPDETVGLENGH